MHVQIAVYDGVDALDVAGPLQVFSAARALGGDFYPTLVSIEGVRIITAACGLKFASTGTLGDPLPEAVIIPGGGWLNRPEHGAWAEVKHGALPEILKGLHTRGVPLGAVATGAMVLAFSGLLKDRRATTHRAALEDLRVTGAHVLQADIVDENEFITSAGSFAGVHLALRLIERDSGSGFAESVAIQMDFSHRPKVL